MYQHSTRPPPPSSVLPPGQGLRRAILHMLGRTSPRAPTRKAIEGRRPREKAGHTIVTGRTLPARGGARPHAPARDDAMGSLAAELADTSPACSSSTPHPGPGPCGRPADLARPAPLPRSPSGPAQGLGAGAARGPTPAHPPATLSRGRRVAVPRPSPGAWAARRLGIFWLYGRPRADAAPAAVRRRPAPEPPPPPPGGGGPGARPVEPYNRAPREARRVAVTVRCR
jgi:hypothetical protein